MIHISPGKISQNSARHSICSALQRVATCCKVLQRVAACCSILQRVMQESGHLLIELLDILSGSKIFDCWGWLNNKGALCSLMLEFWYKLLHLVRELITLFERPRTRLAWTIGSQNQSIQCQSDFEEVMCLYVILFWRVVFLVRHLKSHLKHSSHLTGTTRNVQWFTTTLFQFFFSLLVPKAQNLSAELVQKQSIHHTNWL